MGAHQTATCCTCCDCDEPGHTCVIEIRYEQPEPAAKPQAKPDDNASEPTATPPEPTAAAEPPPKTAPMSPLMIAFVSLAGPVLAIGFVLWCFAMFYTHKDGWQAVVVASGEVAVAYAAYHLFRSLDETTTGHARTVAQGIVAAGWLLVALTLPKLLFIVTHLLPA